MANYLESLKQKEVGEFKQAKQNHMLFGSEYPS